MPPSPMLHLTEVAEGRLSGQHVGDCSTQQREKSTPPAGLEGRTPLTPLSYDDMKDILSVGLGLSQAAEGE